MISRPRNLLTSTQGAARQSGATVAGAAVPLSALAVLLASLATAPPASAQESWELYRVNAVRTSEAPMIDGSLDDPAWERAGLITGFIQQEPDEGAPATERTEVRVLYDGSSLFLGVHAFDSDPDAVLATELRRDGNRILEEDNLQIIIDTFMDQRSAYMFVVTPAGAQLDQQVADEGGRDRRASASASEWWPWR